MTQLYTLRRTPSPGEFIVTKFDGDYEVEAVYSVSRSACSGPDGHRPTCKHRKMLTLFAEGGHIDDGWFLDWDTRMWRGPLLAQDIGEIADRLELDNTKESEPPSLGLSEEDHLAARIAPSLASEASPSALQPNSSSNGIIPIAGSTVEPSSAAPVVAPPPQAGLASSVGGAGLFKRRRIT